MPPKTCSIFVAFVPEVAPAAANLTLFGITVLLLHVSVAVSYTWLKSAVPEACCPPNMYISPSTAADAYAEIGVGKRVFGVKIRCGIIDFVYV